MTNYSNFVYFLAIGLVAMAFILSFNEIPIEDGFAIIGTSAITGLVIIFVFWWTDPITK